MLTEINFEHLEAMPAIILCVEKAVSSYIDRLYREVITWAPEHLSYHSSIETFLYVSKTIVPAQRILDQKNLIVLKFFLTSGFRMI